MNTRRIEELPARVLAGPTPTLDGYVSFQVAVDSHPRQIVEVIVLPCGSVGSREPLDLNVLNPAMVLVADHVRVIAPDMAVAIREAARLRKTAGRAPLRGNHRNHSPPPPVEVRRPTANGFLLFNVDVAGIVVPVIALPDGGICDLPEEPYPSGEPIGDIAVSAVLDYLFADPARARSLGMDLDLLELLWC